jgi:hypothetical protein
VTRAVYLVFANPAAEVSEDVFNKWYDDIHIPDVTAVPGVLSARRFRANPSFSQLAAGVGEYRFLAIYEVESDHLEVVFASIKERVADGRIRMDGSPISLDPRPSTGVFDLATG